MDPTDRLVTPTTRRTIVATGAKLAYVAPLVAVSLCVDRAGAAAISRPPGACPVECALEFCPQEPPEADWVYASAVTCHVIDAVRAGCFTCVHCSPGGRRTVVDFIPEACPIRPDLPAEKSVCVDPTTREVVCPQASGGFIDPTFP